MAGLLPPLVLFTDDERLPEPLAAARALPRGSMVVVRSREAARREVLAQALFGIARTRDLFVLVADDAALAARLDADGLHLPERHAHQAAHWRALYPRWLITAALHEGGTAPAGVDAVFLSPVFQTRSHPDGASLSAVRANAIAQALTVPAYALGGIDARNAALLKGFVGLAAIGALA
jgi:thiamine-phosphate pyrophosphorylase